MWNPFRRLKNMQDEDYTNHHTPYFLIGDEVKTPEGYEAEVIGTQGNSVDVYIAEKTLLETYREDQLRLSTAIEVQGQSAFHGKDWTTKAYQPKARCNHWMDEFKLNNNSSVYLSGIGTPSNKRKADIPEYGCYMDYGWMRSCSIWLSPNAPNYEESLFDQYYSDTTGSMYIKWPDMSVIPMRDYSQVIVWCMSRIMEEGARLEVGCYGGHGRTGTVLAGLLVYNGMDGQEAIKKVRSDYCSRAIETKSQEDLIVKYSTELKETFNGNG